MSEITITQDYLLALRTFWKGVNFSSVGNNIEFIDCDNPPSHDEVIARIPDAVAIRDLGELKEARNALLTETDWTQLPDVPEATRMSWQAYRQELRDITNTYSSLADVVWPTKPSA